MLNSRHEERIEIKTEEEIESLKKSAEIVSGVLKVVKDNIKPGINAKKLDNLAYKTIRSLGAEPAFLGYRNYPATICLSVNNELVHGIPLSTKIIKEGDIVTIDLGVIYKGFYGDVAETVPVGEISSNKRKLLKITFECLDVAVKYCTKNYRIGDMASAVQSFAEKNSFSVIRDYVGHGIGKKLHEKPEIPNFGKPGTGDRFSAGMVFCIEPMIAEGSYEVMTLEDNWTVVTVDGRMCAHFEHMVLVTDNGCQVLTEYKE